MINFKNWFTHHSYLLFIFGSIASRSPSPSRLILMTVMKIAIPGGIQSHGRFWKSISELAVVIIFPHEAVGGTTPNPKKLKVDSLKIAPPILNVPETIRIGIVFGNK